MPKKHQAANAAHRKAQGQHSRWLSSRQTAPIITTSQSLPCPNKGIAMFLLFLAVSIPVIEAVSAKPLPKYTFEYGEQLSNKEYKVCQSTEATIPKLRDSFAHIDEALSLAGSKLTIVCTNKADPRAKLSPTGVYFHAKDQSIILGGGKTRKTAISHELLHARAYFSNRRCGLQKNLAGFSIYPTTHKNIEALNKAFDRGDARIKHFTGLANKSHLNAKQKKQLKAYKAASTGVIKESTKLFVSEAEYTKAKSLLRMHKRDGKPLVADYPDFAGPVEIINTGKSDARTYLRAMPVTDAAALSMVPQTTHANLQAYRHVPKQVLASEREAYTFQALPDKAQRTFYKEAYALRQAHIAACADESKHAEL